MQNPNCGSGSKKPLFWRQLNNLFGQSFKDVVERNLFKIDSLINWTTQNKQDRYQLPGLRRLYIDNYGFGVGRGREERGRSERWKGMSERKWERDIYKEKWRVARWWRLIKHRSNEKSKNNRINNSSNSQVFGLRPQTKTSSNFLI